MRSISNGGRETAPAPQGTTQESAPRALVLVGLVAAAVLFVAQDDDGPTAIDNWAATSDRRRKRTRLGRRRPRSMSGRQAGWRRQELTVKKGEPIGSRSTRTSPGGYLHG
jgi:hypothetical protein